ncbi:ABC transporter ATP-binding protein [Chitinophaga japonensis]|uniref:Lipoprotein-releasing system ATP-binding protein n=1 Tax=Chitinophaga japonensis TaxID=104662 RepID=A0A562T749_CHIJA|nr:ABC transporter ATP-binding protein [Chitinophaga japonensis]TWI89088.1 lipoprotein-releasing system ATP-binding protein [Chitinophaga japonensis]
MEDKVLEIAGVNKYFYNPQQMQVLKDISFSITAGTFAALTGKSGSGKSTLLYLLSTMDTDFEGSIRIHGEEVRGKPGPWLARFRNEHIGFVFQFHYLLPEFTALDNVKLPALKRGRLSGEAATQKACDLLELLGVKDQAGKRTALLSGGQQQRVAIARALINDPLIIMGDEPTGNLDSYNAGLVFDLFKKISSENGQTILMVTHDEDFARRTDRMIHLVDGKIA